MYNALSMGQRRNVPVRCQANHTDDKLIATELVVRCKEVPPRGAACLWHGCGESTLAKDKSKLGTIRIDAGGIQTKRLANSSRVVQTCPCQVLSKCCTVLYYSVVSLVYVYL